MNSIRFGHSEYSILCWVVSLIPLLIVFVLNPPVLVIMLIIASVIISLVAICWMPSVVAKYHLRPAIDRCKSNETTWLRITKDRIIAPQFVSKGPYGQNKGVTYGKKADIIDDGTFGVKWLNGNPSVIMYDLMNTNANLDRSVARKLMTKKFKIRSGVEGYEQARKEGKVLFKDEE